MAHRSTPLSAVAAAVTDAGGTAVVEGHDVLVTGTAHDSRTVQPGDLYCCVVGARTDGHDHAAAAVEAGAAALVVERGLGLGVPELRVASVREAMGPAAAVVAGDPGRHLRVFGVTGTNGKTTVVALLASIFQQAGWSARTIGTLTGARTTPEAPELQSLLADAVADGAVAVAMEVSSHALDMHRVDGIEFVVAGFTNLSADHLDFHGNMEAYFAAKARLFTPALAQRAVVCLDDAHGRLLRDSATIATTGIGLADAHDLTLTAAGSTFTWRGHAVDLHLPGRFNVRNALVAAEMAVAGGLEPGVAAAGLSAAPPVPGRMEPVTGGEASVVVDYAHTPDGLEQVLDALREVTPGRLVVVFGCGGDRDAAKRPLMGAAATRADRIVVTSDNPRSEDPGAIIEAVTAGIASHPDLRIEPDRRRAIALGLAGTGRGDTVLIAGKGHETTQTIGDRVVAFDDRVVAGELLADRSGGEGAS